jgi:hypothetical protein
METRYPNLLSRLLLRNGFSAQFAFPIMDSRKATRFLEGLERLLPRPGRLEPVTAPILVVGLPRTGSTWLQTLLCAHPDVAYVTHFLHHFPTCFRAAHLVGRLLGLDATGERFIGDSVVQSLHSPSEGTLYWGDWLGWDPACLTYDPVRLADLGPATIREAHDTLSQVVALFGPGKRFFAKNPAFIPAVPVLAGLFPDARIIHLVRDPRPTANSMRKLLAACRDQLARIKASGRPMALRLDDFVPYPRLPRLAEYVERFGADDVRTTARLWRDATFFMEALAPDLPNVMTVRFESVLADPAASVACILDFCRLSPLPADAPAMAALYAQTGKVAHVNAYGQYELITDICRQAMPRLGYDPDAPAGTLLPAGAPAFGEMV